MSTLGEANRAPVRDQPAELNLRTIIDASPRLDELGAARLISQAAGVTHTARAGGKPTELSPDAITILADGSVRVDAVPPGEALAYSAPEKVKNQPTDRRSDVFALGVILWEALTHTRLFEGATDDAVTQAVLGADIRPASEYNANVPSELDAICRKALARDPADRYQSCKVMAAELDAVLDDANYPDDNSQIAAFTAKLIAKAPAPKLPAPKLAPKIEAKPEPKIEAKPEPKPEPKIEAKPEPKIEAKPEPKPEPTLPLPISPTASAVTTLKGASAIRDAVTPAAKPMSHTMVGTAITPTAPAPVTPTPVLASPAPPPVLASPAPPPVLASPAPAPVTPTPVLASPAPAPTPTASATNMRSTVIGTALPPGIELLRAAATTPTDPRSVTALPVTNLRDTVKDPPAIATAASHPSATMQGFSLGPVPGSDENASEGPMLIEAPPMVAPTVAAARPPTDPASLAETALPHPAAAVSLPAKETGEGDVISRWAWSSESMPALVDEEEEPPPNRKPLFYAIGGALGVALIISIIAFASSGSEEAKKPVDPAVALAAANKPTEFKPLGSGDPAPKPVEPVGSAELPAVADPQPAGSAEAAVTPEPTPEPAIVKPEPAIVKPEPVPEPVIVKPEPKPEPEPAIVKPEPKPEPKVVKKPEPKVVKKPEPKVIAKKPDPKVVKNPKPIDPYADTPPAPVVKKVDPVEAYRTGLQLYARGDTAGALATFKASLQSNANFAPTYRGLGMVYEKIGQKAAAKNAFKKYLQLAPSAGDSENIKERMEKL